MKLSKYNDKIYDIFFEINKNVCELRKGWCYKEQGVHFIEYNRNDDEELISCLAYIIPCCCKDCINNTRLEDVIKENMLLPKEDEIIKNYERSRKLTEDELDIWWCNFNYNDYRKVVRIVNFSNENACYSNKEYPNIRYLGYFMCYNTLSMIENVLTNKYVSKKSDCSFPEHMWKNIDVKLKMDVYKTVMNAQNNLKAYGIIVKCA